MVRLGLDAVRPVPRAAREPRCTSRSASRPTSSARRSTRPAAGSTRCWRSRRCCSTSPSYRNVVCLGLILDEEGRKMSKSLGNTVAPWDVIDRVRRRRLPLVPVHLQVPVGRLPLLAGDDRRGGPAVPAPAVEHLRLLRAVRQRQRDRPVSRDAGDEPDTTSTAGSSPGCSATVETVGRAPRRLRRHRWPAARSPSSSTSSPTGTCAAPAGASGTATRRRSPRSAHGLVTVAKLLAPFCPFVADEIYDNLDGARAERPPVRLPGRRRARPRARGRRWPSRARPSGSGWPRAGRRSSRSASRCAPPWWSRPAPSAPRSSA